MKRADDGEDPFVGREEVLDRLLAFRRDTVTAGDCRLCLVEGEAGVGKTALAGELQDRCDRSEIRVIRLRAERDSTFLDLSWPGADNLPDERIRTEAEALRLAVRMRRYSRLRAHLILLDDAQILDPEQRRLFGQLLEECKGASLPFILLARPLAAGLRGEWLAFLEQEIPLQGLQVDELAVYWRMRFGQEGAPGMLETLHNGTAGNPSALRAVLQAAIAAGAIHYDELCACWQIAGLAGALPDLIRRAREGVVRPLLQRLDKKQEADLADLSVLGEQLSREAALGICSGERLEALVARGLYREILRAPEAFDRRESGSPTLRLCHSLLLPHLEDRIRLDAIRVLALLATAPPLYNSRVHRYLLKLCDADLPAQAPPRAIRLLIDDATHLQRSADWPLGIALCALARRLLEPLKESLGAERWAGLQALSLHIELQLRKRHPEEEGFKVALEQLLQLCQERPKEELMQRYLLRAFVHRNRAQMRLDWEAARASWDEIFSYVTRRKELRLGLTWAGLLCDIALMAGLHRDREASLRVESETRALLSRDDLPERVRGMLHYAEPHQLYLFDTSEELDRRRKRLRELGGILDNRNGTWLTMRLLFLCDTGDLEGAFALWEHARPLLEETGLERNLLNGQSGILRLLAMRGEAPETLQRELQRLETHPLLGEDPDLLPLFRDTRIFCDLLEGRDDPLLPGEEKGLLPALAVMARDRVAGLALLPVYGARPEQLENLRALGAEEGFRKAFRRLCRAPLLGIEDLVLPQVLRGVLDQMVLPPASRSALKQDLWKAWQVRLKWLAERNCWPRIQRLCELLQGWARPGELASWMDHSRQGRRRQPTLAVPVSERRRIRLELGGTFRLIGEEREERSLRGARVRTLCGLLSAVEILGRTLEPEDFALLASGREDDLAKARNIQYVTVHRLREALGVDVIQTDGERPRWNPRRIQVDVVEAWNQLNEAARQARREVYFLAHEALNSARKVLFAGEAFAGLETEFFDALREDLAATHRRVTSDLARRLEREEDPDGVIQVLQPWMEAYPDDEELGDLLCPALEARERHGEAETLRRRMRGSRD